MESSAALRLDRTADRPARPPRVLSGVRRRQVGRLRGYIVYRVSGEKIRNEVDCDFTCGGTGARYAYIPMKEIWIDDVLGPLDATATLLHEYVECALMKLAGLSYEEAHDAATAAEVPFREKLAKRRPRRLDVRRVEEALP